MYPLIRKVSRWWTGALLPVLLLSVPAVAEEVAPGDEAKAIAQWIDDLGSPDFETQEHAYGELKRLGQAARADLEIAAKSDNSRTRFAATRLLEVLADAGRSDASMLKRPRPQGDTDFELPPPGFPRGFGARGLDSQDFDALIRQWHDQFSQFDREWRQHMQEWQQQGGSAQQSAQSSKLSLDADGRVRVERDREVDGETRHETYEADSMDAFRAQYPEVARELGLGDESGFGGLQLRFAPGFPRFSPVPPAGQGRAAPGGELSQGGPRLGVQVQVLPADDPQREALGLGERKGLLVAVVEPRSTAAGLGVRAGDVILKVGDREIGAPEDVRAALVEIGNAAIEVTVLRRGNEVLLRQGV